MNAEWNTEQREFIVAYSPSFCQVVEATYGKAGDEALHDYACEALSKVKDSNYGDIVFWNNRAWCSVMATNAVDALNKFRNKLIESVDK